MSEHARQERSRGRIIRSCGRLSLGRKGPCTPWRSCGWWDRSCDGREDMREAHGEELRKVEIKGPAQGSLF